MAAVTNERVRTALLRENMTQAALAKYLGISEAELSFQMKRELARKEQDDLIRSIKEAAHESV